MTNDHPRFDPDRPSDWCGSDVRYSNGATFDGIPMQDWIASRYPRHDTEPAPAVGPRWPTLEAIGLGDALDAIEAVAAANQGKHPDARWRTKPIMHQWGKCLSHAGRAIHGESVDPDSGLPAAAHAALRLLMALGLILDDQL